jgi:rhamnulokinase
MKKTFLAVDLGASGGRVMAGHFDGHTLEIEESARFPNGGEQLADGWHWPIDRLTADIETGLAVAAARYGRGIVSVAIDTWGVDYALLDAGGVLVNQPWMYRDSRTDGLIEKADRICGEGTLWRRGGIYPLFFNTVYQLMAELEHTPGALEQARQLLFIPDYLNHRLCGVAANERTIASTSGLLRAGEMAWDHDLMAQLGLPGRLMGRLVEPSVILGPILPEVARRTGLVDVMVSTCGSHDTASAVAGVPCTNHPLFLSSGTWSLLGVELESPVLDRAAKMAGFSNEHGLEGTTRFLSNIAGMWLLQECRRVWMEEGKSWDYAEMVELARTVETSQLINPDDAAFSKPCDMPQAIADWLVSRGQQAPSGPEETIRIILESLAVKYAVSIDHLRQLTPALPDTLHIVGGGSKNTLLNQMTADASGLRVVAGPVEATAVGNVLSQMIACGSIQSLAEGRSIVARSAGMQFFQPGSSAGWNTKKSLMHSFLAP